MNREGLPPSQSPENGDSVESDAVESPFNEASPHSVPIESADDILDDMDGVMTYEGEKTGEDAAELIQRMREPDDRCTANVEHTEDGSEYHRRYQETPSTSETALHAYMEQLDTEYSQRLAELFSTCPRSLNAEERAVIKRDEKLRNKTAYAVRELGIDGEAFGFGEYVVAPYVARNPEISWLAQELNARAQQVDGLFQAEAAKIAEATGALHIPEPVKDINCLSEKIEIGYMSTLGGEDVTVDLLAPLVRDAARCRLVIEGDPTTDDQPIIDQIKAGGLHIAEDGLHRPIIKRGFRHRITDEPIDITSADRYLDTKVTVTVEIPTRDGGVALCEIAIVTLEMATATVAEDATYEIIRAIDTDTEERAPALKLLDRLDSLQMEFYGGVSLQVSERVPGSSTERSGT